MDSDISTTQPEPVVRNDCFSDLHKKGIGCMCEHNLRLIEPDKKLAMIHNENACLRLNSAKIHRDFKNCRSLHNIFQTEPYFLHIYSYCLEKKNDH